MCGFMASSWLCVWGGEGIRAAFRLLVGLLCHCQGLGTTMDPAERDPLPLQDFWREQWTSRVLQPVLQVLSATADRDVPWDSVLGLGSSKHKETTGRSQGWLPACLLWGGGELLCSGDPWCSCSDGPCRGAACPWWGRCPCSAVTLPPAPHGPGVQSSLMCCSHGALSPCGGDAGRCLRQGLCSLLAAQLAPFNKALASASVLWSFPLPSHQAQGICLRFCFGSPADRCFASL